MDAEHGDGETPLQAALEDREAAAERAAALWAEASEADLRDRLGL